MAKVAVPVIKLKYRHDDAFPNAIVDVFEEAKAWSPNEQFTFTGRVNLPRGSLGSPKELKAKRQEIVEALEKVFKEHYAADWERPLKRLIRILNKHDWDISFFVDCW